MRVYLVRHGNANPKESDAARHLSAIGRQQVRQVAESLRPRGLRVGAVWHSVKARAAETAAILAPAFAATDALLERDDLAPNDPVDPVCRDIRRADHNLMIVGHAPFVGNLAAALLTGGQAGEAGDILRFAEAAVACLESDASGWRLVWMTTPEMV
jgi:phosphohistidine phosphatase